MMVRTRSFIAFARQQPWTIVGWLLVVLLIIGICGGVGAAIGSAISAKQIAQQNALTLANLTKSPFVKVTLDSVSVEGSAAHPPNTHALYVHVCGPLAFHRSAIVSRDTTAMVGRKITSQIFSQNLTAGLERFTVKNNPNPMTPKLLAASNWPRYTYLQYTTFLQAAFGPGVYIMQGIALYIIDVGQPLPKPGDPIPQGPGPHDPPQPSCPVASFTPPPSVP